MANLKMGFRSIKSTYNLLGRQIAAHDKLMGRQGTGTGNIAANTRTARKRKRRATRGRPAGNVFSGT